MESWTQRIFQIFSGAQSEAKLKTKKFEKSDENDGPAKRQDQTRTAGH